jgi:YHS domain-containing protein
MNRRLLLTTAFATFVVAAHSNLAQAKKAMVYTGLVEGVGAGGYDVVSYTTGKPQMGNATFAAEHEGAKWYFVSPENMKAFQAAPAKYAPAYGGYCAYAVSQGYTAKGDPEQWSIVGGRLYLNYNASVQSTWKEDTAGYITKGDANWPKVLE